MKLNIISQDKKGERMDEEKKTTTPPPAGGGSDVEQNKGMAAIGYLGILFLVPLLAKKDSPFAQYHAKQGMVLFIAEVIVSFVYIIPFIGWVIGGICWVIAFVLFIIGLMNALGGKTKPLPVIGQFAEKFNI